MVLFDLTVEKQNIHGADHVSLAASANKTIGLRFHFDRHWRDFSSRAAIFKNHSGEYYIIEIKNNIAVIPWEALKQPYPVELSVIAYYTSTVLTTNTVSLSVSRCLIPEEYATKSASETLFGKFRQECLAEAFLDYEDEIEAQKNTYENALLQKQNQITAEQQSKAAAIAEKNAEIAALNLQHAQEKTALQAQLASTQTQLAAMTIKADKWDMLDNAISKKTSSNIPLWGNSNARYSLPDLNTSSMTAFSSNSFGSNLEEIGLDLSSATSFSNILENKSRLKTVRLYNTENVTSFYSAFFESRAVENIHIGNIPICTTIARICYNNVFLKKITIGQNESIQVMESAFKGCQALKEIDTIFDIPNCSSFSNTFDNCVSLEKIRFEPNTISTNVSFSACLNLTKESLLSIINGLNPSVSSKSITVNNYCYCSCFPDEEEREEIYELVTEDKGWIFNLS